MRIEQRHVAWVVLDVMDAAESDLTLLRALRQRGVVAESTIAAGSRLAAIEVLR